MFKTDLRNFSNDYRVAMVSESYLASTGITIQGLKLIGQF